MLPPTSIVTVWVCTLSKLFSEGYQGIKAENMNQDLSISLPKTTIRVENKKLRIGDNR